MKVGEGSRMNRGWSASAAISSHLDEALHIFDVLTMAQSSGTKYNCSICSSTEGNVKPIDYRYSFVNSMNELVLFHGFFDSCDP